jgi:hypothetical protein
MKNFKTFVKEETKTIKVGEDCIGADNAHYGLIQDRKVIAVGTKEEMLSAAEQQGGRVWVTTKQVGDVVEAKGDGANVKAAKERIKRERNSDAKKFDRILDRASIADAKVRAELSKPKS